MNIYFRGPCCAWNHLSMKRYPQAPLANLMTNAGSPRYLQLAALPVPSGWDYGLPFQPCSFYREPSSNLKWYPGIPYHFIRTLFTISPIFCIYHNPPHICTSSSCRTLSPALIKLSVPVHSAARACHPLHPQWEEILPCTITIYLRFTNTFLLLPTCYT